MPAQKKLSEHVRSEDGTRLVAFRMPLDLEKRVLKLQAALLKEKSGARVTLTEVLIVATARGLDAIEQDKAR